MNQHDRKHDPNKPQPPADPGTPAYPPDPAPAEDEGTGPGTIGDPPNS